MAYSPFVIDVPLPDGNIARVQVIYMRENGQWRGDADPHMAVVSEFVQRLNDDGA